MGFLYEVYGAYVVKSYLNLRRTCAADPVSVASISTGMTEKVDFLGKSLVAFAIKIVSAALAFASTAIVGRMLGPSAAGIYFLCITIVTVVATLARLGLETYLVREMAAARAAGSISSAKATAVCSAKAVGLASLLLAFFLWAFRHPLATMLFHNALLKAPLGMASVAILPVALLFLAAGILQGLHLIKQSMIVMGVLLPAFSIIGFALLIPRWAAEGALASYAFAALMTAFAGYLACRRHLRSVVAVPTTTWRSVLRLARVGQPLLAVNVYQLAVTWAPLLALGAWRTTTETGVFAVARSFAMLITFAPMAVATIAAPKFAASFTSNRFDQLEKYCRWSTFLALGAGLPILLALVCFPRDLLAIVDNRYAAGAQLLMLLGVGQFINSVATIGGQLLIMVGLDVRMKKIIRVSAAVNIALTIIFVPSFGALGAAIATAGTFSIQAAQIVLEARKRLGVSLIPLMTFAP